MDEDYIYYDVQRFDDSYFLSAFHSEEGYIETVDSCSVDDFKKLASWRSDYAVDWPSDCPFNRFSSLAQ